MSLINEYAGVDPSDDVLSMLDDDVRPLAEFRNDPRVRATVELGDRFGPTSDEIDEVLDLWDTVAAAGETTSEEMSRDYRLNLDEFEGVLADLPGIEREVETPPDSEDIPIDTLADVFEARQRIDEPPPTVWRFTGGE